MFLFLSMSITILSNLFYHFFQKSISETVNPFISLIATYLIAIIVSVIVLIFYPTKVDLISSFKELNWASFMLGFAIVGLEVGFLLVYRAGWNINIAAIVSNISVAILLIPLGVILYGENLSFSNIIGFVFSILGLILLNIK